MKHGNLSEAEIQFLRQAVRYMERPSLAIRLANYAGKPIEKGIEKLPSGARTLISDGAKKALEKALVGAIHTIGRSSSGGFEHGARESGWTNFWHSAATAATGAGSGALGSATPMGLAVLMGEMAITTGLMLRGIASTADDFGHDLEDAGVALECLMVFSMGGYSPEDDAAEGADDATRLALAELLGKAAAWVAGKTAEEIAEALAKKSAPFLIQLLAKIAARFEIVITEKAVLQAIPVIGSLSGGAINAMFTDHFNTVAKYHFGIRSLEKVHGQDAVQSLYRELRAELLPHNEKGRIADQGRE